MILKNLNKQIVVDELVDLYNKFVTENGYADDVGIIEKKDYYKAEQKYRNIGTTYIDYLNSMLYDGDLFRYDRNTYITITKLNSMGISKQMISDLREKINK
ncbi:MAG: hypothetical protein Q4C64_07865 [Erysipelotrichia bacterium]|nr:hypothetical protein [Erysipelotrichia bacterium]